MRFARGAARGDTRVPQVVMTLLRGPTLNIQVEAFHGASRAVRAYPRGVT
jgi:hypothetical protein